MTHYLEYIWSYIYALLNYALFTFGEVSFSVSSLSFLLFNLTIVWGVIKGVQFFLKQFLLIRLGIDLGTREAITTLITYFIGLVGSLIALESIGFSLSSLVVVAGGLGVGIGLGLQDMARDLSSGIIILLRRTIKVNDFLQFGSNQEFENLQGTVKNISLLSTLINTDDGATLIIPNSSLVTSPILNWSYAGNCNRVKIPIRIHPDSDIVLFTETVLTTVNQEPIVVNDPAPELIFNELGVKYFEFELQAWINSARDDEDAKTKLNYAIEYNLRQRGISVSFPDYSIYLHKSPPPLETAPKPPLSPDISIRDLLRKVPYFANFTELELRKLIEIGSRKRLNAGEVLFQEGEAGDAFYIILEGSVDIFVAKINKHLTTLNRGAFFGELSLILGIPRTASVKAI
jgi:small-conductance mechanosensitive channel